MKFELEVNSDLLKVMQMHIREEYRDTGYIEDNVANEMLADKMQQWLLQVITCQMDDIIRHTPGHCELKVKPQSQNIHSS